MSYELRNLNNLYLQIETINWSIIKIRIDYLKNIIRLGKIWGCFSKKRYFEIKNKTQISKSI